MNTDKLILTAVVLLIALLIGSGLKHSVSKLLKAQKVEKVKFTLAMK